MPYQIKKAGSGWVVVKADTGKVVSRHATRSKAAASIRARYASERTRKKRGP